MSEPILSELEFDALVRSVYYGNNKIAASVMGISESKMKNTLSSAYAKLNVRDSTEAVIKMWREDAEFRALAGDLSKWDRGAPE